MTDHSDPISTGDDGYTTQAILKMVFMTLIGCLVSLALCLYIFSRFCKCYFITKRNGTGTPRRWFFLGQKDAPTPQNLLRDSPMPMKPSDPTHGSSSLNPALQQVVVLPDSPQIDYSRENRLQQQSYTEDIGAPENRPYIDAAPSSEKTYLLPKSTTPSLLPKWRQNIIGSIINPQPSSSSQKNTSKSASSSTTASKNRTQKQPQRVAPPPPTPPPSVQTSPSGYEELPIEYSNSPDSPQLLPAYDACDRSESNV